MDSFSAVEVTTSVSSLKSIYNLKIYYDIVIGDGNTSTFFVDRRENVNYSTKIMFMFAP